MKRYPHFFALVFIVIITLWAFHDMKPSDDSKASYLKNFSITNTQYHLQQISKKPHYVGSPEHKVVQQYIVNEFKKMKLQPEVQYQSVVNKKWRAATTVENILVRIKGSGSGKALLVLSHYDSSPHSSLGASDAGSGVVTIVESIRTFLASNTTHKNDIIVLISDAEELGLLGAKAFVEYHPWAKDVGLVLNLEARGSGGPSYMLMETNGKNGKLLTEFINANPTYPAANSLMYSIYKMLPNDTDLTVFRENGDINGFNFAFIGDHFDYHTAQDSYQRMDISSLKHQADYLMSGLHYFANADLNSFESNADLVYANFPFIKLLSYPFAWVTPMLLIASILFIVLLFIGVSMHKLTIKGILYGFLPFLAATLICVGGTYGLWKGIGFVFPSYTDMLHGFTYNGYWFIAAFSALNIWGFFKIYKSLIRNYEIIDFLVAPITFWLIINFLILENLKGAGFFIIPVYIALLFLAIHIFTKIEKRAKPILFTILSIPTLYIFTPMIKIFPVGLGLGKLFVAAIFIVLLLGIILPVFSIAKSKNSYLKIYGFISLVLFIFAFSKSSFSEDKKFPNSLVYIEDKETNNAYYATYNTILDEYIQQALGDSPQEGGPSSSNTQSKYKSQFKFHKKTQNRAIPSAAIYIDNDTIIDGDRILDITIEPKRKVNKIELTTTAPIWVKSLCVNGASLVKKPNENYVIKMRRGTLLSYFVANTDDNLRLSLVLDSTTTPDIFINEISFDLLTNPAFDLTPRTATMMPMPFITNDAIITTKSIQF